MTLMPEAEPWSLHQGDVGILFIHGFTGSPKSMRPWAEELSREGWTVHVPRLPGHGTSWQDMNTTTWHDWYAEVERAFLDLRSRCSQVFVMGLSMGGTLTLRLAQQHGDAVSGIVLVNPAVHSERNDRFLLPIMQRFVPSFPGISNDIAKPDQDEGAYTRIPLKAAHSLSQLWKLVKADMSKVRQPLLLFRSVQDHVVEPSNSEFILMHAASVDIEEILLHDSYHVATLDFDAPVITRDSTSFVKRLTA